ncbi:MAG: HEAT repeat domain-containing protein [Anaerolineae bacterium]|nr:HEAT repeat domain-containing protein [Anaerolineae bacterium]
MPLFGKSPNIKKLKENKDIQGLIEALEHKEPPVSAAAAQALGDIGDRSAIEPLIAMLQTSGENRMAAAAGALRSLGDAAVDPLIAAFTGAEPSAQEQIAHILGEIGAARAVETLMTALEKTRLETRERIIPALGAIGDARAIAPLIGIFEESFEGNWQTTDNERLRTLATGALASFGDAAINPLVALLKNMRPVSLQTALALDQMGWKPDSDENAAWYYAAKQAWGRCPVQPFIAALKDSSSSAASRVTAAEALGRSGSDEAIEPLRAALNDADSRVRLEAKAALYKLESGAQKPQPPKKVSLDKDRIYQLIQQETLSGSTIYAMAILMEHAAAHPLTGEPVSPPPDEQLAEMLVSGFKNDGFIPAHIQLTPGTRIVTRIFPGVVSAAKANQQAAELLAAESVHAGAGDFSAMAFRTDIPAVGRVVVGVLVQ